MTRPEDIPADVWDRAFDALHPEIQRGVTSSPFAYVLQVGMAKAILAERERCCKYATDQAEREPYGHCKATAYIIADNILGGP